LKPEFEAPKYKSRKQLNNWLTDKHRREQILLRTNNVGQLSWFFHIKKVPELEIIHSHSNLIPVSIIQEQELTWLVYPRTDSNSTEVIKWNCWVHSNILRSKR